MGNISLIKQSTVEKLKQFFSVVLAFTTTLSLSGFALTFAFTAAAQVATLNDGDLVRGPDGIKVYIVKTNVAHGAFAGWKRHIFNPEVFNMYGHLSWSKIKSVNQATLDAYQNSDLYSAAGDPAVYLLEEMGASAVKHWITDPAVFASNGYSWSQIFTVNEKERDFYVSGANVGSTTTTTPTTPVATGTGLSVSLAANTPAAGSVVADSTSGDGAQAQASMLNVNFTAGTDGDVNVTTVKVKRSGISADSDIANAYLYDGMTRVAEMTSSAATYITFTNASGLFTVSRGTTKAITVKVDIANGTTAGKTIALSINAMSDVTAGSAAVSGMFPVMGNFMTTANVTDLGELATGTVSPAAAATVDPGQTSYEMFRLPLTATNQNISVSRIKLTNIGSVATTDITNIKLMDGATQYGATALTIGVDGTVTFDLSASPMVITAGQTKNLSLKGDIVGGTTRTYRWSVQRSADIVAMDNNYGVYLKPNKADSFTIVQAGGATTINSGTLTISVDSTSPTGNVAKDYIDQELARFQFKANGEAVKITSLSASSTTTGNGGINNAKLYLDGTQVGATTDLPTTGTVSFTFGNTFTIPAGATKTLIVKGEVKTAAAGSFTAGNTIQIFLAAGSSNAQGQTSMTSLSSTASNGYLLTVQSGAMTVAANSGLGNATASLPTGVKGATNIVIGSFVLTAGSGEAVQVSQIVVKNSATSGLTLSNDFQNLTLKNGNTVIGTPIGGLSSTASATYTFTPSSAITINAGQQYVVNVYADILTSASNAGATAYTAVIFDDVTANGVSTSGSAGYSTDVNGQSVYISTGGSLVIAAASDMPVAQVRSMGQVGQTLAAFKFTTGAPEGVNVTKIIVTDTMSGTASAATGTVTNLGLFKGDGTQVGTYVASMTASGIQDVIATFNGLTLTLPRDAATVLYLKGDVNGFPNGTSGSAHTFKIALASDVTATGAVGGGTVTATGPVIAGNASTIYRSELTVANAMSNISGGAGTGQTIGKYRLTNTSAGNYTITVSDIDLGIASTIATPGASRYITLRRDSTSGTVVAKKGFNGSAFADITTWPTTATASGDQSFDSFTIDAVGGTGYVDLYVLVDTNDAASTKTISTTIGGGTNVVTWTDGVTSNTSLDGTPIAGATVTY